MNPVPANSAPQSPTTVPQDQTPSSSEPSAAQEYGNGRPEQEGLLRSTSSLFGEPPSRVIDPGVETGKTLIHDPWELGNDDGADQLDPPKTRAEFDAQFEPVLTDFAKFIISNSGRALDTGKQKTLDFCVSLLDETLRSGSRNIDPEDETKVVKQFVEVDDLLKYCYQNPSSGYLLQLLRLPGNLQALARGSNTSAPGIVAEEVITGIRTLADLSFVGIRFAKDDPEQESLTLLQKQCRDTANLLLMCIEKIVSPPS